jgi:hypothetical protein
MMRSHTTHASAAAEGGHGDRNGKHDSDKQDFFHGENLLLMGVQRSIWCPVSGTAGRSRLFGSLILLIEA